LITGTEKNLDRAENSGYSNFLYADSLNEFGIPIELNNCVGWLLSRPIANSHLRDCTSCYPMFSCRDWSRLKDDLDNLPSDLVSVVLVSDPFGEYDQDLLLSCFDYVIPFKKHYSVDLEKPFKNFISKTHLKFALSAQHHMQIELCANPSDFLDDWCRLYGELVLCKNITGISTFSRRAFQIQLAVPGIVLFRASVDNETIALDWWYIQGEVAHGHLVAIGARGYELHASYALKLAVLEYFKDRLHWLNLGGVPGLCDNSNNGLAAFKKGWSNGVKTTWLCGRIINKQVYNELAIKRNCVDANYFPVYRQGKTI